MDVQKATKADHTVTLRIGAADIIASLPIKYRKMIESGKADVFVRVPGGGDWSNSELALEADVPVQVRISYSTEK